MNEQKWQEAFQKWFRISKQIVTIQQHDELRDGLKIIWDEAYKLGYEDAVKSQELLK